MNNNIKYLIVSITIVGGLSACLSWIKPAQQAGNQIITVDLIVPTHASKSMVGFLHSFNETAPSQNLIDDLSPRVWRMGGTHLAANYRNSSLQAIRGRQIKPIVICSDYYFAQKNKSELLPVSSHLTQVTQNIEDIYSKYGNNAIYDIWNEPNHSSYWQGSESDFFNMFKVAHDKIRSLPGGDKAIISGPSIDKFDKAYIDRFLAFCAYNNIRLDILSWHDFRSGDNLIQLKKDLQWVQTNWVKKYPSLGIKKIQLNEIVAQKDQYSPLVPLMYFKAMEEGGADASCKGCWPNSKGISNCNNNSLDGLVTENGEPRSIWWAYKYYNESVQQRLASTSSSEDLMPFAYQAPGGSKMLCILLANCKYDLSAVTINLKQLKSMPAFKRKKEFSVEYYQIPDKGESPSNGLQLIFYKES